MTQVVKAHIFHLPNKKNKYQKGEMTYPGSHSNNLIELGCMDLLSPFCKTLLVHFSVWMHVVFFHHHPLVSSPTTVLEYSINIFDFVCILRKCRVIFCVFILNLHKSKDLHILGYEPRSVSLPHILHQHCFYNLTVLKCIQLVHWCKSLPSCASTFYLPIPLAMDT